jgi:FKBP12-rapamycin complex-associated protein
MLVNAMEVSGIEGTFRSTCEAVLRVLRKNKNSVMAVLEAFVYDPLINWRLLTTAAAATPAPGTAAATTAETKKEPAPTRSMLGRPDANTSGATTGGGYHHSNVVTVTLKADEKGGASGDKHGPTIGLQDSKSSGTGTDEIEHEELNAKALTVIRRVEDKLSGTDFDYGKEKGVAKLALDVPAQVQRLIAEATSHLNLCQSYIGWCPFW